MAVPQPSTPAAAPATSVLRKHLTERFTQVPNETIRDARLSFQAVGVLVHIISLPDGSQVSATTLAATHTNGRHAVLSALKELEEAGYYHHERIRDDLGRVRTVVTVSDVPMDGPPECGYPTPGDPTPDNPTPSTEDLREDQEPSVPTGTTKSSGTFPTAAAIRTGTPYPPAFEAFWKAYPRRIGKTAAYKAWLARVADAKKAGVDIDRRTDYMTRAAANYAVAVRGREQSFIKHASTFIGPDEHWKDYAHTAAPEVAATPEAGQPSRRAQENIWD